MNFFLKVIHRVHSCFGQNPNLAGSNKKEIEILKEKVFNGKKNDIKKIHETNDTLRLMIEKGEINVRVIRKVK